jgi:hypothetical protein
MSLTYPAAFCFSNAADTASITASSSLPLTPPSNLQTDHVGQKWRAETDTVSLTITLAAATTIDTMGLFGLKALSSAGVDLTSSFVTRMRASLTDTSAVDGAVYDSGSAAGRVSSYYNNLVCLMDGSASARYLRYDLSCAGAAYIEAGFTMIGLRNQVGINFAHGATDAPIDPSVVTTSRSGADFIDQRNAYREWNFTFEALNETERYGWVADLDYLIGARKNVMVIRDPSSTNLGRDTLLGRITNAPPTATVQGFIAGGLVFSKTYNIKQRQ